MLEQQLVLKYKGGRDYLHGTDMFNETLTWLNSQRKDVKEIDFAFHRLAIRQLKAVLGPLPEGIMPVAVCSFTSGGVRESVSLVETDHPVMERYPYPEDEIVSPMVIDIAGRKGVLSCETAYSDIELWVAMTKALHQKVFSQLKGKWLFVRARFPQFVRHAAAKERTLVIAASFNDKLTRSEVFLDGVKSGEIYFSIV
ncbi:MAG: hypothetical protein HGB19_03885 [Chlorobiales bacterium]|jgi:hypothetical protein|nr:hypothetical protein [Chlorobiales bacterium]